MDDGKYYEIGKDEKKKKKLSTYINKKGKERIDFIAITLAAWFYLKRMKQTNIFN